MQGNRLVGSLVELNGLSTWGRQWGFGENELSVAPIAGVGKILGTSKKLR